MVSDWKRYLLDHGFQEISPTRFELRSIPHGTMAAFYNPFAPEWLEMSMITPCYRGSNRFLITDNKEEKDLHLFHGLTPFMEKFTQKISEYATYQKNQLLYQEKLEKLISSFHFSYDSKKGYYEAILENGMHVVLLTYLDFNGLQLSRQRSKHPVPYSRRIYESQDILSVYEDITSFSNYIPFLEGWAPNFSYEELKLDLIRYDESLSMTIDYFFRTLDEFLPLFQFYIEKNQLLASINTNSSYLPVNCIPILKSFPTLFSNAELYEGKLVDIFLPKTDYQIDIDKLRNFCELTFPIIKATQ